MNLPLLTLLTVVPLLLYSSMVWYFFPAFYSSESDRSLGLPIITQAGFDVSSASSDNPLSFSITAFNQGQTTDIQIVSVSFPNLSGDISKEGIDPARGYVKVKDHNFTQSPLFVASGDTVGKEYSGGAETTAAKYPSIEFFSRPWKAKVGYSATLEISANSNGRFLVLVKAISLPHFDKSSHYPQKGFKDYQQEFVAIYPIFIK